MASTEETIKTLTSRCIVISMVKNTRRIPLRINRKQAKIIRQQLAKYQEDIAENPLPNMEQTFIDRNFADYRNIEAFINLVTVVPPEKRETILTYAKEVDEEIAEDEGLNFYADLYKALEFAFKNVRSGKVSIQAIANNYNEERDKEEKISNRIIGRHLNIMGLRRSCRMPGGRIGRIINKKIMKRLKRRYNPNQNENNSEDSERSEHTSPCSDLLNNKNKLLNKSLHRDIPSLSSLSSQKRCAICRKETDDLVPDKNNEFLVCKECRLTSVKNE